MASYGPAEQIEIVATLQQTNDAAGPVFLGQAKDFFGHLGKIRVVEHQTAQWITATGIEARRNDDQIGWKLLFDLAQGICEGLAVIASGSTSW